MKGHHRGHRCGGGNKVFLVAEIIPRSFSKYDRDAVVLVDGYTSCIRRGVVYILYECYTLRQARELAYSIQRSARGAVIIEITNHMMRMGLVDQAFDVLEWWLRITVRGETEL